MLKTAEPIVISVADEDMERSTPAVVADSDEWMPPKSSTIVEYATPPRRRYVSKLLLWSSAILFLLAIVLVITLVDLTRVPAAHNVALRTPLPPQWVPLNVQPVIASTHPAIDPPLAEADSKLTDLTSQNESLRAALAAAHGSNKLP